MKGNVLYQYVELGEEEQRRTTCPGPTTKDQCTVEVSRLQGEGGHRIVNESTVCSGCPLGGGGGGGRERGG